MSTTRYSLLNYVTPPSCQGQIIERSYALTPDEVVRRTTDNNTGEIVYETADLCELMGNFEPQNRVPSVFKMAWDDVDGEDDTPEDVSSQWPDPYSFSFPD